MTIEKYYENAIIIKNAMWVVQSYNVAAEYINIVIHTVIIVDRVN